MITLRRSEERGHANYGWLDTCHTFSFGRFHDPRWTQFRGLRVLNQDIVAPGRGFATHPHHDMEIITWVIEGKLRHKDSAGHESILTPGRVQRMSAGTGIAHSEHNASDTDPLHLIQIWLLPSEEGLPPEYAESDAPREARMNRLFPIAAGNEAPEQAQEDADPPGEDTLRFHQDTIVYASLLEQGISLRYLIPLERAVWIHLIDGELDVLGETLKPGDGAGITQENELTLASTSGIADFLMFDLG